MIKGPIKTLGAPVVPGRISVIMPCYNSARFVEESVVSVMQQSYPDVELMVVDDGSTDASPALLDALRSRFPERLTVLTRDNRGPYPARNHAARYARGEFIAFLDADDYWSPTCLEKLHAALTGASADVAYCGWQNVVDGCTDRAPHLPPEYEKQDTHHLFLKSCPWPIHAALLRRSVFETVGGFSERAFSTMDFDLWLRISGVTTRLVRVPAVMAFYRWHGEGQISKSKWKQAITSWEVRTDFVHEHPDKVAHIPPLMLTDLIDGELLRDAYDALWRRDVQGAKALFRKVREVGCWKARDLKYLLPSLLPGKAFEFVVGLVDSIRSPDSATPYPPQR